MREVYLDVDRDAASASAMTAFMTWLRTRHGVSHADYRSLHAWACEEYGAFWSHLLEWSGLPYSGDRAPACVGTSVESARFFPHVRLNYAECLLRPLDPAHEAAPAIVARTETGERRTRTRAELRETVVRLASALRARGIEERERVAAVVRNTPETVEFCLAAASIGAVFSSVAPDLGPEAILDRFRQLAPAVLLVDAAFRHHGVERDLTAKIEALLAELPSVRLVVVQSGATPKAPRPGVDVARVEDLARSASPSGFTWTRYPFDHPLFILFSSGTTGVPKALIHGAGGTLLEHVKEHRLHTDLSPNDLLFFHTSTGWMMWNWVVSALASGTPIMLLDGSMTYPEPKSNLEAVDAEGVTVLGTSPAYVQTLRAGGVVPRVIGAFSRLRAIQSTGSILYPEHFDWIRDDFKHVPVHSISGGTDIIGCFVLGNPLMPVYRGESQSISLGLDVRVLTENGLERVGTGELVCANPFPSRPVGILGDDDGARYHQSYFAENEGLWTHGDAIELTDEGSARILGRSDATMKIRGIRIGPAEIYAVVLAVPGVTEAMAVTQADPREPGGTRMVLLVVLAEGCTLDRPLTLRIKKELNTRASPAHVPAVIAQVSGLPQTHNGKYSERAARDVINGRRPPNRETLRNPQVLDEIAAHPLLALGE